MWSGWRRMEPGPEPIRRPPMFTGQCWDRVELGFVDPATTYPGARPGPARETARCGRPSRAAAARGAGERVEGGAIGLGAPAVDGEESLGGIQIAIQDAEYAARQSMNGRTARLEEIGQHHLRCSHGDRELGTRQEGAWHEDLLVEMDALVEAAFDQRAEPVDLRQQPGSPDSRRQRGCRSSPHRVPRRVVVALKDTRLLAVARIGRSEGSDHRGDEHGFLARLGDPPNHHGDAHHYLPHGSGVSARERAKWPILAGMRGACAHGERLSLRPAPVQESICPAGSLPIACWRDHRILIGPGRQEVQVECEVDDPPGLIG